MPNELDCVLKALLSIGLLELGVRKFEKAENDEHEESDDEDDEERDEDKDVGPFGKNGDKQVLEFSNDVDKYMYVNLHSTDIDFISSNEKQILRIDFNVDKSIKEDNGRYILSPSVRPYSLTNFGEIEGIVSPFGIKAKVSIEDGLGNLFQTTPEADGLYKIRGLLEGDIYMVTYEAPGYLKQTISNVSIIAGKETLMDPITLIQ
jgi:hypothetical protein